jgi:hypothetical protein
MRRWAAWRRWAWVINEAFEKNVILDSGGTLSGNVTTSAERLRRCRWILLRSDFASVRTHHIDPLHVVAISMEHS